MSTFNHLKRGGVFASDIKGMQFPAQTGKTTNPDEIVEVLGKEKIKVDVDYSARTVWFVKK